MKKVAMAGKDIFIAYFSVSFNTFVMVDILSVDLSIS